MTAKPIVLSYSDMQSFLGCRQKWDFSSSLRMGMRPLQRVPHFEFGGAWADAMALFYSPHTAQLGDAPRQALTLSRFTESIGEAKQRAEDYWQVLDPEQADFFDDALRLGHAMLNNYFGWAAEHDDFTTVGVEREFVVPLLDPQGQQMYSRHGVNDRFKEDRPVLLYIRVDGLVKDKEYGTLWLLEDKTAKTSNPLFYLEIDFQTVLYLWALQKLDYDIKGLIYTQAFKHAPVAPKLNQNSTLSVDKRQYTTTELFSRALLDLRKQDELLYRAYQSKYDEYLKYLASPEHAERFFRRRRQPIARGIVDNLPWRLYAIATEMLGNPAIYPHVTSLNCNNCKFRSVCAARQDGRNWRAELMQTGEFQHKDQLPNREDRWVTTNEGVLSTFQTTA